MVVMAAARPRGGNDEALTGHRRCYPVLVPVLWPPASVLLLYTPHGLISGGADACIYTNETAAGTCEWMGGWDNHRVSVTLDT